MAKEHFIIIEERFTGESVERSYLYSEPGKVLVLGPDEGEAHRFADQSEAIAAAERCADVAQAAPFLDLGAFDLIAVVRVEAPEC